MVLIITIEDELPEKLTDKLLESHGLHIFSDFDDTLNEGRGQPLVEGAEAAINSVILHARFDITSREKHSLVKRRFAFNKRVGIHGYKDNGVEGNCFIEEYRDKILSFQCHIAVMNENNIHVYTNSKNTMNDMKALQETIQKEQDVRYNLSSTNSQKLQYVIAVEGDRKKIWESLTKKCPSDINRLKIKDWHVTSPDSHEFEGKQGHIKKFQKNITKHRIHCKVNSFHQKIYLCQ